MTYRGVDLGSTSSQQELLRSAIRYLNKGWPVLALHAPLRDGYCSCGDMHCSSVGKHPRTKRIEAATSSSGINSILERWPDSNIGILTGHESGLVVIDIDNKDGKDGDTNFTRLCGEHGWTPRTLTCKTPHGRHVFLVHPPGRIQNSVSVIGEGIDIRAAGGYVIAPPSISSEGIRYEWVNPSSEVEDCPAWLAELISDKTGVAGAKAVPPIGAIAKGERNTSLAALAGSLRRKGMSEEEICSALLEMNLTKCSPPLPEGEVAAIAHSISRYSAEPGPKTPLAWWPEYPDKLLSDRALLMMNDRQKLYYLYLRAECWRDGGTLPADPAKLWRLARATSRKMFENQCGPVLDQFETQEVAGELVLVHRSMAELYQKQLTVYRQRCEASEKAAQARRARGTSDHPSKGEQE